MSYITVDNKLVLIDGKPIITPNEPESQEKTLDITANGTYTAEPDSGKMLSKVTANVNVPSKPEQFKNFGTSVNGTYNIYPDSGYTLSGCGVTVNVSPKPEQTKSVTITNNQTTTITPDEGKTLSSVSVTTNVPTAGILGRKIGTYTVTDGILSFSVEQEDFEADDRYANLYVKTSKNIYGLFALRGSTSYTNWFALCDDSSGIGFSSSYISVEKSGAFYNINWTLGSSSSEYYSGEVTVYALPSS